jgi:hypothetical protein
MMKLLKSIYPDHTWHSWMFEITPRGSWDNLDTQREYLKWVGSQLNLEWPDGWYSVQSSDIIRLGGVRYAILPFLSLKMIDFISFKADGSLQSFSEKYSRIIIPRI